MSFLQNAKEQKLSTNPPTERQSLPEGQYGSTTNPGLEILMYVEKASKPDKSGNMRHSFLVKAITASKESQGVNGKTAAAGDHAVDTPDGTAFLSLTLADIWLNDEPIALAMGEAWVAKAIEAGVPQENFDHCIAFFKEKATDACIAANTPSEQLEEAVQKQYEKILTQIRINVGLLFRLQDWKGISWDAGMDVHTLVGTQFGGRVTKSTFGDGTGAEVKSVYELKH